MPKDTLDRTVSFLKTRDGTDKTLKILRYSAKLALALNLLSANEDATARLRSFESSVGVSRKALRIGKFLQDVDELRKAPSFGSSEGFLELVASGGECVYYFIEQFIWLVKAGAIDKRHGSRLQKLSASFELLGYTGSVTLKALQVASMLQKEQALVRDIKGHMAGEQNRNFQGEKKGLEEKKGHVEKEHEQVGQGEEEKEVQAGGELRQNGETDGGAGEDVVARETAALRVLRFKRVLKLLALIQDLSDSLLALADVIDEPKQPLFLRSPAFLAAAGLLSAVISAHKNWVVLG